MQDIKDIQDNDKSPLLKAKKTRPPPSEKQKENFQKMAAVRAENIKKRKEEKLLEAQQALLAKNGIEVPSAKKEKLKEKQPIQFEIEEKEESEEEEQKPLAPPMKSTPKVTLKKEPKQKQLKAKVKPIIEESETDYSSDSSEEVIVIKRGKKKPKAKVQKEKERYVEEDNEEEYVAEPAINYTNYFC
jgi:hypothetical protein